MRTFRRVLSEKTSNWAICLLSASFLALAASVWMRPSSVSAQGSGSAPKKVTGESRAVLDASQEAFVRIADTVEKSVVTITAKSTPQARPAPMQDGGNLNEPKGIDPFEEFPFFRRFRGGPGSPEGPGTPGAATGSGVIIRETGSTVYVLTNNHVVDGRDKLRIVLQDKSEFTGELVGRDMRTDLAVVKFQTREPLPAGTVADLGDSDRVKVGQWAIAIGSPLGYESTLTVGVISAKGRELNGLGRSAASYTDLIQTDASINPGNSGGPLVNIDGEVVGINVAIAAPFGGQGNIGIGFAIPVNAAKSVAEQLISKGKVTRGFLGVQVSQANRQLSPELRRNLNVPNGGALIENVSEGGPAARAEVRDGDVIVRFGGREIRNFSDLEKAVAATTPGSAVPLEVVRDRKQIRLNITVAERPDEDKLLQGQRGEEPGAPGGGGVQPVKTKYGLTVRPSDDGKGVQVVGVAPGSPAEDAGLSAGDVIVRVNDLPAVGVDAFQKALNAAPATEGVVLRVRTAQGLRFVVIKP